MGNWEVLFGTFGFLSGSSDCPMRWPKRLRGGTMSASLMLAEPDGPANSCLCSLLCCPAAESALTLLCADCAVPPSARHLDAHTQVSMTVQPKSSFKTLATEQPPRVPLHLTLVPLYTATLVAEPCPGNLSLAHTLIS